VPASIGDVGKINRASTAADKNNFISILLGLKPGQDSRTAAGRNAVDAT
jgi:hypothetical protein